MILLMIKHHRTMHHLAPPLLPHPLLGCRNVPVILPCQQIPLLNNYTVIIMARLQVMASHRGCSAGFRHQRHHYHHHHPVLPQGLITPIPTHQHLWSHLARVTTPPPPTVSWTGAGPSPGLHLAPPTTRMDARTKVMRSSVCCLVV